MNTYNCDMDEDYVWAPNYKSSQSGFEKDFVWSKDTPWQCGLYDLSSRVMEMYANSKFTDITLTFHGTDKTYDAHRLILALSSPIFERMFYGPMRTEEPNILLHDDPLAMGHVIAHCYGYDTDISDDDYHHNLNIILEVYKLADKYLLFSLKEDVCKFIVRSLATDPDMNGNDIIKFAERYNFIDLKSKCLPLLEKTCETALNKYGENECYINKPDNVDAFEIVMRLSDEWIEGFLSNVNFRHVLDFHKSWKYPESPLKDNRLRAILSSKGWCSFDMNKFYGCIDAEIINQFPLAHIAKNMRVIRKESLQLCLSVTDPHHAKRVIEAINQQNGFENTLVAIHMKIKDKKGKRKRNSCEEVWPRNWSPIRPERTHRPSILLISGADDSKVSWIVEAAKAFLPQCEGSDTIKLLKKRYIGERIYKFQPISILKLPRSNFTPNGFMKLLQDLSSSGVKYDMIYVQSPHISITDGHERIGSFRDTLEHTGFNPGFGVAPKHTNFFRNVFDLN